MEGGGGRGPHVALSKSTPAVDTSMSQLERECVEFQYIEMMRWVWRGLLALLLLLLPSFIFPFSFKWTIKRENIILRRGEERVFSVSYPAKQQLGKKWVCVTRAVEERGVRGMIYWGDGKGGEEKRREGKGKGKAALWMEVEAKKDDRSK